MVRSPRTGAALILSLNLIVAAVALAVWFWLALLFVAPWVAGIAWHTRRTGGHVVLGANDEAVPSAAELSRRRLGVP